MGSVGDFILYYYVAGDCVTRKKCLDIDPILILYCTVRKGKEIL
jgi:hypothetical protein